MKAFTCLALMAGALFLATGCNEYTTQICTAATKVDVPGIEGVRTAVSYDAEKHAVQKSSMTIAKTGTGSYSINGAGGLSTCRYGNTVFAEVVNSEHQSYTSYVLTTGSNYFDLVVASLDKAELDAAGIPNKEITYPNNQTAYVADNSQTSAQTFVNLLHATSFAIRLY